MSLQSYAAMMVSSQAGGVYNLVTKSVLASCMLAESDGYHRPARSTSAGTDEAEPNRRGRKAGHGTAQRNSVWNPALVPGVGGTHELRGLLSQNFNGLVSKGFGGANGGRTRIRPLTFSLSY
jgi:hypothetical protein